MLILLALIAAVASLVRSCTFAFLYFRASIRPPHTPPLSRAGPPHSVAQDVPRNSSTSPARFPLGDQPIDPGCSAQFPCSGAAFVIGTACYPGKCPASNLCTTGTCACSSDAECVGAWYRTTCTPTCSNCGNCQVLAYYFGCDVGGIIGVSIGGLVFLILATTLVSVYAPCCKCCYTSCACCCCCCRSCAPKKAPQLSVGDHYQSMPAFPSITISSAPAPPQWR